MAMIRSVDKWQSILTNRFTIVILILRSKYMYLKVLISIIKHHIIIHILPHLIVPIFPEPTILLVVLLFLINQSLLFIDDVVVV